ncbi:MAG TPA: acyl carrier protein [Polyangiaceae bacterium]|jgi:acyl carrier protein|nr:acyl carrier protein [Polyangiaceae bacterium]
MDRGEVFDEVVAILRPFAKNPAALATVGDETSILRDLKVNSARFVEVLVRIQRRFAVAITDEEADRAHTVGDVVRLVVRARGAA